MSDQPLRVNQSDEEGVTILQLAGSIDLETHDFLSQALEVLYETATPPILLDLQGITYLDSGGLFRLLSFSRNLEEKTGETAHFLIDPDEAGFARRIFETARLSQVLPVYLSREEALEAFRPASEHPLQS